MLNYTFAASGSSQNLGLDSPTSPPPSTAQSIANNLLVHIPTESVTLVTTLSPFVVEPSGKVSPVNSAAVLLVGLLLMICVRYLARASVAVWLTSFVAFFLWMSLLPYSALQEFFPWIKNHQSAMFIFAAGYSAAVALVANYRKPAPAP